MVATYPRSLVMLFGIVALLSCAPLAHAQSAGADPLTDDKGSLWADLGMYIGGPVSVDAFALSPLFGGSARLSRSFALEAKMGFAYVNLSPEGQSNSTSSFRAGNPFIGGHYIGATPGLRYRIGFGIALPVASLDTSDQNHVTASSFAYNYAAAMRGNWDLYLWSAKTMSFVAPARIESSVSDTVVIGGDAALGILVPTSDAGKTNLYVQLAGDLAVRFSSTVRGGFRLSGAWVATADGDNFQSAFEPFLRADWGNAYVDGRLTMNLDSPWGFAFDTGRVWGLRGGAGVRF